MHPYPTHTPVDEGTSSGADEPEARVGVFTRYRGRSSRCLQPMRPADPDFRKLMGYRYYRIPRPDRYDSADQMRKIFKKCFVLIRSYVRFKVCRNGDDDDFRLYGTIP